MSKMSSLLKNKSNSPRLKLFLPSTRANLLLYLFPTLPTKKIHLRLTPIYPPKRLTSNPIQHRSKPIFIIQLLLSILFFLLLFSKIFIFFFGKFLSDELVKYGYKDNKRKIKGVVMFKLGLFWVSSVQYLLLVPLYIISGPICMVSSSLFDWTLKWVVDDQTFALMIVLMVEWTISVLFIAQLMMSRTGRTIIFYEFVFFIVCLNFIFIGITYTLLQRYNIIEQFTAKVCTSLMLVLIGEKLKKQYKDNQEPCSICFNSMNEECIILKCSHVFHESCLWEWVYIKQECPTCKKKI